MRPDDCEILKAAAKLLYDLRPYCAGSKKPVPIEWGDARLDSIKVTHSYRQLITLLARSALDDAKIVAHVPANILAAE